jgi:hypothetical protein
MGDFVKLPIRNKVIIADRGQSILYAYPFAHCFGFWFGCKNTTQTNTPDITTENYLPPPRKAK